jgi:hypothetical protein
LIKGLLKLALVALIANAAWHIGTAYLAFYKFKDAVQETTQFDSERSDEQLRQRILELASDYDVPIAADGFTVQRSDYHTIVDGAFTRKIDVLPGYAYPWSFSFHTDTFVVPGAKGAAPVR